MESLANRYRPETFNDIVGQDITVKILKREMETGNISHVYLFAGTTGCGKTTTARILARAIGGQLVEIDSASNNGADYVRQLVETAQERSLTDRYKVIVLDECQNFSTAAWSVLLKSLEEPPEYTVYILCTTEPRKVPEAVKNRAQCFDFKPLNPELIASRLKYISEKEGYRNYDYVCNAISHSCGGSVRKAISALERYAALDTNLSRVEIDIPLEKVFKLIWAVRDGDIGGLFQVIDSIGTDAESLASRLLNLLLDLEKYHLFGDIGMTSIPSYLATRDNPVVQYTVKDADGWLLDFIDCALSLKRRDLDLDTFTAGVIGFARRRKRESEGTGETDKAVR